MKVKQVDKKQQHELILLPVYYRYKCENKKTLGDCTEL